VAGSIRSSRVIEVLSRLISERGTPTVLRSDNGPEFVSKAILEWIVQANIQIALIAPGKPWQNGTDESFNGSLRDECLNVHWFENLEDAKATIEGWRREYNETRPHMALKGAAPEEYAHRMGV